MLKYNITFCQYFDWRYRATYYILQLVLDDIMLNPYNSNINSYLDSPSPNGRARLARPGGGQARANLAYNHSSSSNLDELE